MPVLARLALVRELHQGRENLLGANMGQDTQKPGFKPIFTNAYIIPIYGHDVRFSPSPSRHGRPGGYIFRTKNRGRLARLMPC